MPGSRPDTLRAALVAAAAPDDASLTDGAGCVRWRDLLTASPLAGCRSALAGKSVLVAVDSQRDAGLMMVDLDGLARRLVLLPPDVKPAHLPSIIRDAEVEAIVCSNPAAFQHLGVAAIHGCGPTLEPIAPSVGPGIATSWLMLTSGTSGLPKIAVHTLASLTGAIPPPAPSESRPVWATFYDIRRYGGLQIFLRAVFSGATLVLSRTGEQVADHLARLSAAGVTHVSGTPSHWRRVLMSAAASGFAPRYVRLSGEIADQAILDALRATWPDATISHAYASTEAGVGFTVTDGREGFPASYLGSPPEGVELRIVDGALHVRSDRVASGYAGRPDLQLADPEGWVDTGDMIEIRGDRCHFAGRRGGIINVGGLKVHPEEIEAVINRHAAVRQSRVMPRRSPIIGAVVVADVVLRDGVSDTERARADILDLCRSLLPAHKIPALLNIVPVIEMTAGGKVSRQHA